MTGVIGVTSLVFLKMLHLFARTFPAWVPYGFRLSELWAQRYSYLLFFGLPAAIAGVTCAMVAIRQESRDPAIWVALVLNTVFVLTSARLYAILFDQGFFGFVLSALPRFVEV